MTDTAIHVDNLSKLYHIGMLQQRHDTLRDALTARFRRNPKSNPIQNPIQNPKSKIQNPEPNPKSKIQNPKSDNLWALRDVSFEVQRGEVVGIIGRNGAGKSTLLKILSRITEPTSGRAEIHGRVGSLLEVGTGFHPELTGRENIYLNGAILGMRRTEIDRQFDEIVAFAEIERFLDTPVKRYSSGMYVRLAFAVAAHLEPEILLVDEVLAVGDAAFQKKCLGKMGDVAREGRTVLFVSHNMAAVKSLCPRGLLFEAGELRINDSAQVCVDAYAAKSEGVQEGRWTRSIQGSSPLEFREILVELQGEQPDLTLLIDVRAESISQHRKAFIAMDIASTTGTTIMQILPSAQPFISDEVGFHRIKLHVNLPPLIPGLYILSAWVGTHNTETLDRVDDCTAFVVTASPTRGRSFPHTIDHGYIVPTVEMEYTLLSGIPRSGN